MACVPQFGMRGLVAREPALLQTPTRKSIAGRELLQRDPIEEFDTPDKFAVGQCARSAFHSSVGKSAVESDLWQTPFHNWNVCIDLDASSDPASDEDIFGTADESFGKSCEVFMPKAAPENHGQDKSASQDKSLAKRAKKICRTKQAKSKPLASESWKLTVGSPASIVYWGGKTPGRSRRLTPTRINARYFWAKPSPVGGVEYRCRLDYVGLVLLSASCSEMTNVSCNIAFPSSCAVVRSTCGFLGGPL